MTWQQQGFMHASTYGSYFVPAKFIAVDPPNRHEPTPEQKAEAKARYEAAKAYERRLEHALSTTDDPRYAALAQLHSKDASHYSWGECSGCDFSGYEGEPPSWPCRTAELLGDLLGVPGV